MLKPGEKLDGYIIQELLGKGGFGAVYKAQHPSIIMPGRHGDEPLTVAIKELSHTQASVIERFQREAGILIQMSSKGGANFSRVIDLKEVGGHWYLIMEYVAGGTLELAARRQISEGQLIRIAIEICKGLEVMHGNKPSVVHRDMKPANVKVEFDGGDIIVKVIDFGVSAVLMGQQKNEVVGTFAFAGAAQMRGEFASPWMDQHSLGTTLYYCMTDAALPEDNRFAPFPFVRWQTVTQQKQELKVFPQQFQDAVSDHFHKQIPAQWDPWEEAKTILRKTGYSVMLQDIVLKMMMYDDQEKFPTIIKVREALERMSGASVSSGFQPIPPPPTIAPVRPAGKPVPPSGSFSGAALPFTKKTTR